jgi:hypothetical protein
MVVPFNQLSAANFVGHYPLVEPADTPGGSKFFIGVIAAGTASGVDESPPVDGALDISDYVSGVHVSGKFSYTRSDATVVSATFDAPFCTKQCGGI